MSAQAGPIAPTDPRESVLRRAAIDATLAPSVGNSQPWEFVLGPGYLDVYAVRERRLPSDPAGRQLLISCGCAVFNARVSLAASGAAVVVDRCRDRRRPTRLARISITGRDRGQFGDLDDSSLARYADALATRRTNRRAFSDKPVPADLLPALIDTCRAEGADLVPITTERHERFTVGLLGRPGIGPPAGVEIRNGRPLLLLVSDLDQDSAWARAGEALERVLLEATRLGLAVSLLSELLETTDRRERLRQGLALQSYPHLLLEIGYAEPTPATRRRRLVDVLRSSR